MKKDIEHLNLLGIFHYVMAGLTALMAFFPLIYVVFGVFVIAAAPVAPAPAGPGGGAPPPGPPVALGWFMIVFGVFFSLLMVVGAVLIGVAGYGLQRRKWRIFCFVIAALLCTQAPIGTILGVFTIIVLCRPTVQDLFSGQGPESSHDPEDDDRYDPIPRDRFEDRPAPRPGDEGYYAPRGDST